MKQITTSACCAIASKRKRNDDDAQSIDTTRLVYAFNAQRMKIYWAWRERNFPWFLCLVLFLSQQHIGPGSNCNCINFLLWFPFSVVGRAGTGKLLWRHVSMACMSLLAHCYCNYVITYALHYYCTILASRKHSMYVLAFTLHLPYFGITSASHDYIRILLSHYS